MAATQIVPGLEVSAPDDDMDLHTDDGFDFGDGDIELDLDPAPSAHDEDLSIHDAVSDSGFDLETGATDQDDFMADHGDLIEEDIYDDDAGSVVMQALADDDAAAEASMLPPPDEDLIDYSDDEGQQLQKIQSNVSHQEDIEIHDGEGEDLSFLSNAPLDDTQTPGFANHSQDESRDNQEPAHDDQASDAPESVGHVSVADVQSVGKTESPSHDGHHADGEDGGVQLPAGEDTADAVEDDHNLSKDEAQSVHDDTQGEHQDSQPSQLRPITVNYAGSEFWLFKQHDSEDSGDWLLEDISIAKSSMSELFQACRSSLGDDVSNEHELGFCFDHLNSLEVYEDNTACVAVTLERLTDLYYMLQTQDDNTEPEPFYVTLQFRPRFATLLSDVAKFADNGRGYSAFTSAIAAGETHFPDSFALPSEHDYHSSDYDDASWNDQDEGEKPEVEGQENEEHTGEVQDDGRNTEVQEDEEHDGESQEGDEHAGEEHQDINISASELQRPADDHETDNTQPEEVNDEVHDEAHDEVYDEVHEAHDGSQEVETHQPGQESEHQEPPTESANVEQTPNGEHDADNHQNTALEQTVDTNFHQGAVEESPEHHDTTGEPQTHVSPSFDGRTPEQILHDKQTEADIVDYSDDEDQEDDEASAVALNEMSQSSTTVQGDGSLDKEETGGFDGSPHVYDHNDELHEGHDQNDGNQNDGNQNTHGQNESQSIHDHDVVQEEYDFDIEQDGTTLAFDEHVDDEDEQTYHEDVQEYEQDGSFQDFDADVTEGDFLERTLQGDSAQDFDGLEYETLVHESHIDMDGEYDGDTVADSVAAEEETAGADEILDLDNAPEWVTDKEPRFELPEEVVLVHDDVAAHDEEDDLGDISAVTVSQAADPTAASSAELTVLSPQRRKRSIDEVGNGLDEATESTGMIVTPWSRKRAPDANICVPDAKRPRV
jgi:hypothetical protein